MTLDDLVELLGDVGVPVLPPGTPTAGLPAIVLQPGDDDLAAGGRRLTRRYDVVVLVPRSGQVERLAELNALEVATIRALIASTVDLEGPYRFAASDPADPVEAPYFARIIPIAYTDTTPEAVLCP